MAPPPSRYADDAGEEMEDEGETDEEAGGALTTNDQTGAGLLKHEVKYSANDFVQWTSFKKKIPVLIFCPDALHRRIPELRQLTEKYHMAYKLYMHECKLVRNILAAHGFREAHPNSSDYNLMWTGSHVKPFVLRSMLEHQKINHFPRSYELTRKDRLYKNVQRMQQMKGFKHFDFVPTTFVLPTEFNDFTNAFLRDKGTWIVKPVASSRGRGIFLVNHPDQVPTDETFVVCRYIQKPFLIDGFKFDLRLYVAVTSFDPLIIYLFEEGLTRFATVRFDKSQRSIQNQCMHLTNYSVNKKNDDFVRNEDPNIEDYGNKWSLGALLRCLREEGHDATAVMMRIEDVIIKTILSAEAPIATACKMFMPYRGNCFEIFGFDVLLDSNLRPWVLEVNLSPSLNCDSPLDLKIKSHMVSDLLSLSGFVLHDPCTRIISGSRKAPAAAGAPGDGSMKQRLQRPQSASGRPQSAQQVKGHANGSPAMALTPDEAKLVRRVKEEHARRGGWIRIFPTRDTWDLYSDFLQFTTTSNMLMHEQLFKDNNTGGASQMKRPSIPLANKLRTLHIHDTPAHVFISSNNYQMYERLYVSALQRSSLYERKLGEEPVPIKKLRSQNSHAVITPSEPAALGVHPSTASGAASSVATQQPVSRDQTQQQRVLLRDEERRHCESRTFAELPSGQSLRQHEHPSSAAALAQGLDSATGEAGHSVSSPLTNGHCSVSVNARTAVSGDDDVRLPGRTSGQLDQQKWDAVKELQSGVLMSKMQARRAFATYLTRVQHRLLTAADDGSGADSNGVISDDGNDEQTDLVLRFLKRAAANLSQTFKVVVPSRRLPLIVRRRILAKQLGDFVHLYSKETDILKVMEAQKQMPVSDADVISGELCFLNENKFESFISFAEESELEVLLTAYTKISKSASTFLGRSGIAVSQSLSSHTCAPAASSAAAAQSKTQPAAEEIAKDSIAYSERMHADQTGEVEGALPRDHTYSEIVTVEAANGRLTKSDRSVTSQALCDPPSRTQSQLDVTRGLPTSSGAAASVSGQTAAFTSSYASAVNIYSTRLQRPLSASGAGRPRSTGTSGSAAAAGRASRPASARHTSSTTQSIAMPTAAEDAETSHTYHGYRKQAFDEVGHEDVNAAFNNLRLRQKERNYRTLNVGGAGSSGTSSQAHRNVDTIEPAPSHCASSVHAPHQGTASDGAMVTATERDLVAAYSAVTGVKPSAAFVPSKHSSQYEILKGDSAERQQQMIAASRALLEASKAMHQEMVAQAHAVANRLRDVRSAAHGDSGSTATLAPRPPPVPRTAASAAAGRRQGTAVRRQMSMAPDSGAVPDADNTSSEAFYSSLKYDALTGLSRPTTK